MYICTAYQESPDCSTFKHEPGVALGPRIPYLILSSFQKLNPGMNFVFEGSTDRYMRMHRPDGQSGPWIPSLGLIEVKILFLIDEADIA